MGPVLTEDCRWVSHRDTRILIVSYGRCRSDGEMLSLLAEQVLQVRAEGTKVRVLHDYRNAFLGERFLEESKRLSRARRESTIDRAAVVGLRGIQKALFQTYRLFSGDATSRVFETPDEALEWLVSR